MANKRVETNIDPVHPMHFKLAKMVEANPHATQNEKILAMAVLEIGCVLNKLLLHLEYGMVHISDAPPDTTIQYTDNPQ